MPYWLFILILFINAVFFMVPHWLQEVTMSIKFQNFVMVDEPKWDIKRVEPIKKEIKKVYKKQSRLSKSVVVYKPKLTFENDKV